MNTPKKRLKIPQMNKVRAELQKEIKSECPFCKNTEIGHFEIHHIDEDPSNNTEDNLILLCPLCHSKITKGDISQIAVLKKKIELMKEDVNQNSNKDSINVEGYIKNSIIGNNNIIKFSPPKKTVSPKYPEGCIGFDTIKANYIGYLIGRYNEYKEWEVSKAKMNYSIFGASLKKHFNMGQSRSIYNLPINFFDELVVLVQNRINGTMLAKTKGKTHKNFRSFEEYTNLGKDTITFR